MYTSECALGHSEHVGCDIRVNIRSFRVQIGAYLPQSFLPLHILLRSIYDAINCAF
jgi:hypothetical protein